MQGKFLLLKEYSLKLLCQVLSIVWIGFPHNKIDNEWLFLFVLLYLALIFVLEQCQFPLDTFDFVD